MTAVAINSVVAIHGLVCDAYTELNGQKGKICGWDAKHGRWKVQVAGQSKLLALHAQNLTLVQEGSDGTVESSNASSPARESSVIPLPSASAVDQGHFQAIYVARSIGGGDSLCVVRRWHEHSAHVVTMLRVSPSLNWTVQDIAKLSEWGFQFLSGTKGRANWPVVLSTYAEHFLLYVARRLGAPAREAKQPKLGEKARAARAVIACQSPTRVGQRPPRAADGPLRDDDVGITRLWPGCRHVLG